MVYAFFDFLACSQTVPILSGLILALSRGASRDLKPIQAGETRAAPAQGGAVLARAPAAPPALASCRRSP